jgi:hypothetical protein
MSCRLIHPFVTCIRDAENLSPRLKIEVNPPSGPVNAANTSGSMEETSKTGKS